MNALPSTSEIVESIDVEYEKKVREKAGKNVIVESENKYTIDDEINQLFEAINVRTPSRGFGSSNEINRDSLRKSAMKRPIRVSSAQASGIGISEPVNLKQALRGLCISHASEMAAMKRLSRPTASPGGSDSGTIKRLYRRVAAEDDGNDIAQKEPKGNLVEISLVPEKISLDHAVNISEDRISHPLDPLADATEQPSECRTAAPLVNNPEADPMVGTRGLKSGAPSKSNNLKDVLEGGIYSNDLDIVPANSILPDDAFKSEFHPGPSQSGLSTACRISKPSGKSPLMKPIFRNKSFIKKKAKQDPTSTHFSSPSSSEKIVDDSALCTSDRDSQVQKCGQQNEMKGKESASAESSSHKVSIEVNSSIMNTHSNKTQLSASGSNRNKLIFTDLDEKSSSKGKGEFSQSSKSSIGDYSSSTSISEESYSSGSFCSGNRHHMSKDLRWKAIRSVQKQFGALGLSQFKLLKRLGCGDIGTVYLAELTGTSCLFALKLMENEFLVSRKKLPRAQTEREILQMLDHPFLPTLYAHFATDKLSCLVMEYCPGGDLHVLRQKQPSRSLSEQAARFYVAEVLLALEYLHMLGVVYRDLKPENILVREDGHIMLTDFDLSLRCAANPMLVKSTSPAVEPAKHVSSSCTEASCINPFCLHPSWQVSCFTPRLLAVATKSRKMKSDLSSQISPLPELVVEPTGARSNSFVGTHEYLAPEIIKGDGHGSAVDWWTFGIFLFELLYGRTPFKGSGNEETLANVVSQSLRFPSSPIVSFHARDLIRGLLVKEPESRLGSVKGAAEIKQHPFFEGLNWALIRCAKPPELPKLFDFGIPATSQKNESKKYEEFKSIDEDTEFEMF